MLQQETVVRSQETGQGVLPSHVILQKYLIFFRFNSTLFAKTNCILTSCVSFAEVLVLWQETVVGSEETGQGVPSFCEILQVSHYCSFNSALFAKTKTSFSFAEVLVL